MKKFRLLPTLFVSAFAISALAGCAGINDELPNPQIIIKDGLNINSISFENVPDEIPAGYFDTFGIYLKVVYSDNSEEQYPLTISNLPNSLKHLFNIPGTHKVTIAFRGHEVAYTFKVVPGKEKYVVTYYNYDGSVVQKEDVMIDGEGYATVTKGAPSVPNRPEDSLFIYTNPRWEQEIAVGTQIYDDYNIYPIYDKTQKRYNSRELVPTTEGNPFRILRVNKGSMEVYPNGLWLHAGRLERVPLIYSAPQEKTTPSMNVSLYFDGNVSDNTQNLVNEIYAKGFNVNTSKAGDYFTGINKITNPYLHNGVYDPTSGSALNKNDPLTMLKGDTSYTPLYLNSVFSFVSGLNEDHKEEFSIKFPEDLLPTSTNYYRGAIETSVDVILRIVYNTALSKPKIEITEFDYYFVYDANNIFKTVEYSNTEEFNAAGNIVSFDMDDLRDVLLDALEFEL